MRRRLAKTRLDMAERLILVTGGVSATVLLIWRVVAGAGL